LRRVFESISEEKPEEHDSRTDPKTIVILKYMLKAPPNSSPTPFSSLNPTIYLKLAKK